MASRHCPASGELSTDSWRTLGNFGDTGAILRRTVEVQDCSVELTVHEVNPGGFAIKKPKKHFNVKFKSPTW